MILLDTCALVWIVQSPDALTPNARQAIRESLGFLFVSAISAFEIALKSKRGAIELPMPPKEWFAAATRLHGIQVVPISAEIAAEAAMLPEIHRDPFDRIIVATASVHRMAVLTADRTIPKYPQITTIW